MLVALSLKGRLSDHCKHDYLFVVFFSSSLDDLEVDSRGEVVSERAHIHSPSVNSSITLANSRDELDSSETSTNLDFHVNRMESLSSSKNLHPKVSGYYFGFSFIFN